MGLRVWSGGEILSKKINKEWGGAHKAPPPIITKVNRTDMNNRAPNLVTQPYSPEEPSWPPEKGPGKKLWKIKKLLVFSVKIR